MSSPAEKSERWNSAIRRFPQLAEKYGSSAPEDPAALREYASLISQQTDILVAANAPEQMDVETPDPIDWGQRIWDIYGGVPGVGLAVQGIAGMAPGIVGELARDWSPDLSESSVGARIGEATFMPFLRAFDAWQETIEPGAATLNALFEPGVRERYNILRERGIGPASAIQSAYDQAKEAGEIPWWQSIATEVVTDPLELIPGIGLYGAATKAVGRGIRAGTRAGARSKMLAEAEELGELGPAARQAEAVEGASSVDMSPYAQQSTFLDEAGRTVAPTEEVVSRIPEVVGAPGTQSTFLDESVEGGVRNFATRQVWDFPSDYAYKTPIEEAVEPAGVLPTPAQMFPERPFPTTGPIRIAETMANVGTVQGALKGTTPVHVVEWEPWVMDQYNISHGTNFTAADIADDGTLAALKASNAEHYHASPVCKNLSKINIRAEISENDWAIARAVARDIREVQPPSITIENVPAYKGSLLHKQIVDALEESGYVWDEVITDAADWGAPQYRERLFMRATKRGELPPLPTPMREGLYWEQEGRTWLLKGSDKSIPGGGDWYELLKDLIDLEIRAGREEIATLGSSKRMGKVSDLKAKSKKDRDKPMDEVVRLRSAISDTTPTGRPIEIWGARLNEDSFIYSEGGSATAGRPSATNAGRPAPTLLATERHTPRIFLTGNGVKLEDAEYIVVTPRMMARLMGLPDAFKVPAPGPRGGYGKAKQAMGNGVQARHTELFIQPMVDKVARTRPVPGEGQVLIGGKWVWPIDRPENIVSPTQGASKWLNVNTLPKVEPHELDALLADDLLSSLVKTELERRLSDPMNAFSINPISYATRNLFVREIVKEMGRVSKASGRKPPTYEMVEDYLTRLVSGDPVAGVVPRAMTAEGRAVQGRLFEALSEPRMLEASTWDDWLNDYYQVNPDGSYSKINNRPISGARTGTTNQADEAALSEAIETKAIYPQGDPHAAIVQKGGFTSNWANPNHAEGFDIALLGTRIVDATRSTIREMLTPSERQSYSGITGTLTRGLAGGKTMEAFHSAAARRYDGIVRALDEVYDSAQSKGTQEMKDLGWLDKNGVPIPEANGVWEVSDTGEVLLDQPGPLEILRRALHGKSGVSPTSGRATSVAEDAFGQSHDYLSELRAYGPDAERQYWNLRTQTDVEEGFRRASGTGTISSTDYFYRGMTRADDAEGVTMKMGGELGRAKSFERAREQVSRLDLMKRGYVDLFPNPYQMSQYSSMIGTQQRLEMELLSILKDQSIGLARPVKIIAGITDDSPEILELRKQGWRTVEDVGPALKGEPTTRAAPKKFNAVPDADKTEVDVKTEWIFHPQVANTLEDMFAPPSPIWQWFKQQKKIKGVKLKPDDLLFWPKRAKLFGSLFQQIDFAQRAGISGTHLVMWRMIQGMKQLGKGNIDKGFSELVNASWDIRLIPKVWWDMSKAYVSPNYRARLRALKSDKTPFYDDPDLADFNYFNLFTHGLHVSDSSFIRADEAQEMVRAAARDSTNPIKTGAGWFKRLEKAMRDGLFDGVYPASILHDVRYNILPMVRTAHPDLNSSEIMAIVVERANVKWSTIPAAQSVFKGSLRQLLTRIMFSVQEFEAVGRQTTGAISGPNAGYWRQYWASALVFWIAVGNAIHFTTTSLTQTTDKGLRPDLKVGELLPANRYIPFHNSGMSSFSWGYSPRFMTPDIPIPTRSGDRAKLDLLMQLDLVFRVLDGSHGVPLGGFIETRMGAMPRAFAGWVKGEDFYGRDTEKWGYGQKALQFVYDSVAPIGAGQLSIALLQEAMKEQEMPGLPTGALLPGGTIGEVAPGIENTIGLWGHGWQALGLNVKSKTKSELRDMMVEQTFGEGDNEIYDGVVLKRYSDLRNHPEAKTLWNIANNDNRNDRLLRELDLRAEEGSETFYDDFNKMLYKNKEITQDHNAKVTELVEKHQTIYLNVINGTGTVAWSPSEFRADLKVLNNQTVGAREQLEKLYMEDPRVAQQVLSQEAPDRGEDPLGWAIYRHYELRDEFRDKVTKKIDYRRFDAAWAKEQSGWTDEEGDSNGLIEMFDMWQNYGRDGGGMNPFIEEYYEGVKELREAGYWNDTPSQTMARVELSYPNARVIWNEYLNSSREEKARQRAGADRNRALIIQVMEAARRQNKKDVIMANPELDKIRVVWFGNVPLIYFNRELFKRLYGKYPSSASRHPALVGI